MSGKHQRESSRCFRSFHHYVSIPYLSPLGVQKVPLGGEGHDKEAVAGDITRCLAPRQSEGAVRQLTDLQVSGSHHPLRN